MSWTLTDVRTLGQRFNFGRPDLQFSAVGSSFGRGKSAAGSWCATLLVNGRRIGVGEARNKKDAQNRAYLDTSQYLESCDPDLWNQWCDKKALSGNKAGGATAHVVFDVDPRTDEELRETVYESRDSGLYKRAKAMVERDRLKALAERERQRLRGANGDEGQTNGVRGGAAGAARRAADRAPFIERKSEELLKRLENYQIDPRVERMRTQRASLPVGSHASSVLAKIATSSVVVVLAATGSGKTTQVPQLILDDWIMRGEGAKCNIVCTQPRRIAAISVAERVAKERGENIGDSVGYQVRFESKPPKPDGSILFCTTGLFLRRLQTDLANNGSGGFLDGVTHVAVDEVHERDVDTDLLLFVLRRLLHERRKAGKAEIRVILM
jgi:HrpA-like RNA helicase